jgi:hypothetical protein
VLADNRNGYIISCAERRHPRNTLSAHLASLEYEKPPTANMERIANDAGNCFNERRGS